MPSISPARSFRPPLFAAFVLLLGAGLPELTLPPALQAQPRPQPQERKVLVHDAHEI